MTADLGEDMPWGAFIDATLGGYLGTLERDPVAARAFVVEMDGAGPRRPAPAARGGLHLFASLLAQRHAVIRERDPSLGPLPERVYLGLALGIRQLVQETLEEQPRLPVTDLADDIRVWIGAVIAGAREAA